MQQLRSKMAQLNKKEKQAFIAELTMAQASDEDDEQTKKKKKRTKKNVVFPDVNVAEAVSAVPAVPLKPADATSSRVHCRLYTVGGMQYVQRS